MEGVMLPIVFAILIILVMQVFLDRQLKAQKKRIEQQYRAEIGKLEERIKHLEERV